MKRNVQILLLFACLLPVFAGAREETMEERKRRITRKYLRERVDVTYSETSVPDAEAEDENVLDSEKFREPQVDLQRQEPGAIKPLPTRQPPPRTENRDWLLSEEAEMDDPYADPFAMEDPYADPFSKKNSKKSEPEKNDWTWGREREPAPYTGMPRDSRFNWRSHGDSYGQPAGSDGSGGRGIFQPRDRRSPFTDGMPPNLQQQGRQASDPTGEMDPSRRKPFNSIFNQERSQSPFFQKAEPATTGRSFGVAPEQQRTEGYTPYKSPYQTQRDRRQEQWNRYNQPKQEFQRPNTFQQWKEKNATQFDPTSDDAFVEELMPKTRR